MTRKRKDLIFGLVIGFTFMPIVISFLGWAYSAIGKIIGGG